MSTAPVPLAPIDRLPPEMFQDILERVVSDPSFVSMWHARLSLVSKRFHETLLQRPDLYLGLTLPEMHLPALHLHLRYSAPRQIHLTIQCIDRQDWGVLFANGDHFESLDILGAWSNMERFARRSAAFRNLVNLRLNVEDRSVPAPAHAVLVKKVPALRSLVLAGGNITAAAAIGIAGQQRTVKHLTLVSALHSTATQAVTAAPDLESFSVEDTHLLLLDVLSFLDAPSLPATSFIKLKIWTFNHRPQPRQCSLISSHHGIVQDPALWAVHCMIVDSSGKELGLKLMMRARLETMALVVVCVRALAGGVADVVVDSGCSLTESEWSLLVE
ncbi:hypothetical protein C8F01DRAFT_1371660 [Mycena amicta]|nr:hypothetical protein C8F01DRAFT_1371660 [Mycena amicta]